MNQVIQNIDTAFKNDFCRGLTHHAGHGDKTRARGSIALPAATDGAFRVSVTENNQVMVVCQKMKDAAKALPMLFDLKMILLLIGEQNDQSYVLKLAAEGQEAESAAKCPSNIYKVSDSMRRSIEILDTMYAECEINLAAAGRQDSVPRIAISDWRDTCIKKKIYQQAKHFGRALDSMKKRNLVKIEGNSIYIFPVSIYSKYFNKERNIDA
jgi:hypothetical protein